jgi:hypothetical protein
MGPTAHGIDHLAFLVLILIFVPEQDVDPTSDSA